MIVYFILPGKETHSSATPIIDWLWNLFKCGFALFIGVGLMKADPETNVGVRQVLKFFAAVLIVIGLLASFGHWSGLILFTIGCFTYWLFKDASVKKLFDEYVRDYEKSLAKAHPKLDRIRRFLSKIVFGVLILILIVLGGSLLVAIFASLFLGH